MVTDIQSIHCVFLLKKVLLEIMVDLRKWHLKTEHSNFNYFYFFIYSLCKNNAISKVLNKLQVFHFRSTVHTNTTPKVITHSCVLQKPPFCNDNGYKFEFKNVDQSARQ